MLVKRRLEKAYWIRRLNEECWRFFNASSNLEEAISSMDIETISNILDASCPLAWSKLNHYEEAELSSSPWK